MIGIITYISMMSKDQWPQLSNKNTQTGGLDLKHTQLIAYTNRTSMKNKNIELTKRLERDVLCKWMLKVSRSSSSHI
jgi:hypothetical protein